MYIQYFYAGGPSRAKNTFLSAVLFADMAASEDFLKKTMVRNEPYKLKPGASCGLCKWPVEWCE